MSFTSDAQYYVLVKLCRTAGNIHLFKITGKLTLKYVILKRNILWDVIEIDRNKINLPSSVIILLRDEFKIRCIMEPETLLFHVMLKQGVTWFLLVTNDSLETV